MRQGDSLQTSLFFKKALCEVKASGLQLSFDRSQLGIQQKQTVSNFRLLIQRYAQFWLFRKGSGSSFYNTYCV